MHKTRLNIFFLHYFFWQSSHDNYDRKIRLATLFYWLSVILVHSQFQNRFRNCQTQSGSWSFVGICWIFLTPPPPPLNLVVWAHCYLFTCYANGFFWREFLLIWHNNYFLRVIKLKQTYINITYLSSQKIAVQMFFMFWCVVAFISLI